MIRAPYLFAGALAAGLASATAVRFSLAPVALVLALGVLRPRLGLACALALTGWWWGSERLDALDRSVLAPLVDTAGNAIVDVEEPPRRGRYEVRVRALVVQVNGKVRDRFEVDVDLPEEELVARAKASPRVQAHIDGAEVRKTIVVPNKLVNIVVSST